MASLGLDVDSPHFEYFPPTPSPSDDESELIKIKPTTEKPSAMSNGVSNALPPSIPKDGSRGQTKVNLHLGHLPSKKDIKGPWPRTPTRVSSPSAPTSYSLDSLLCQVDPNNPPWPAYRGYHEYSFAHATMGVRLPTILGKAIDDVTRTLNEQSSEEKIVDLVHCIDRMDVLMQDLSGNQKLRPIIDDGEADVALWNKEIAKYFQGLCLSMYSHVSC